MVSVVKVEVVVVESGFLIVEVDVMVFVIEANAVDNYSVKPKFVFTKKY